VFVSHLFIGFSIVVDLKGRSFGFGKNLSFFDDHFYPSCYEFVIGLTLWTSSDNSCKFDDIFAPKRIGDRPCGLIVLRIEDGLSDSVTVAQIDEDNTTVIATIRNPSGEGDFLSDIGCIKLSAGMRSIHKKLIENRMFRRIV